jgi:hypothetical protein
MSGSKINVLPIVKAHYQTLYDNRTNKLRARDYIEQISFPVAAGGASVGFGWSLKDAGTMAAATGLLAAFLFGLTIRELENAEDFALSDRPPGKATTRYAKSVGELVTNAAYASLIAFVATAFEIFGVLAYDSSTPVWLTALIAVTLAHLAIALLMVLRRVFLWTHDRLMVARTGDERDRDRFAA